MQADEQTPRPLNEEMQSDLTRHGLNIAAMKAKLQLNDGLRDAERERVVFEYGLREYSDYDITQILKAERQIEICRDCGGAKVCKRNPLPYRTPVIQVFDGRVSIGVTPCLAQRLVMLADAISAWRIPLNCQFKELSDFAMTSANSEAHAMARWFIEERPRRGMYFYGGCGAGKTFLAAIIAQDYQINGYSVAFTDMPSLFERLKSCFDEDSRNGVQDILDELKEKDLLVLDDFGAEQVSEWSLGILFQIINHCYSENRRLVVTSNYPIDELAQRFRSKDKYAADRIISRLKSLCEPGYLGEEDWRTNGSKAN